MKQHPPSQSPASRRRSARRGFTTPAVAIALLVVMGGLALILDRLWLDAADLELTTAAEAAALVAASELASDDLLKPAANREMRLEMARNSAGWIASQNLVAGDPVMLDLNPQGDVRLGRLVLDDLAGRVRFEETDTHPTTAVVTALRTRRSSNPVGLFISGVTGQSFGDVATRVEASVDNRVCGVRPLDGAPVPALPIAIWWNDPTGRRVDTWRTQIEARRGQDRYGYDSLGHRVTTGADGIPEITLRSQSQRVGTNPNVIVVDVGGGLNDKVLARQFASGWTAEDLARSGGELRISDAAPETMRAAGEIRHADRQALDSLIGEPRICLLYSIATSGSTGEITRATGIRLVAIRVLAVHDQSDGSCEIVAQPCVITTRTAILDAPQPYSTDGVIPVSPYLANPPSTASTSTASTEPSSTATVSPTSTSAPTSTPSPALGASTSPSSDKTGATKGSGHPFIYKLHLTH